MPTMTQRLSALAAGALILAACGSSSSTAPQGSATLGADGGSLSAGRATLSVPAGALAGPTLITVREVEPEHAGRLTRIELEPRHLALSSPALLSVRVEHRNVKVLMHRDDGGTEHLVQVEVEDRARGEFKTTVDRLGEFEVEEEHGQACTAACGADQECDDGVCKPRLEDAGAGACSPVCASGLECDDGACKPHGGDAGPGAPAACDPACAAGLECDDSVCKPHGGG